MPTDLEIANTKQNLANMYDLLDDLQLDFTDVMDNLRDLLANPNQNDPGQQAMSVVINAFLVAAGTIASAASGGTAFALFAGLGALAYNTVNNNPPADLHGSFADYETRFVRNIHEMQSVLATYSANIEQDWGNTINNPSNNQPINFSLLGTAGFLPGKVSNLEGYNTWRSSTREAADYATWKYFTPLVFRIGVRDNMYQGGSNLACLACFASDDALFDILFNNMHMRPVLNVDFMSIKGDNGNCTESSNTNIMFNWWSLTAGNLNDWASPDVIRYLIKDDGFGNVWNAQGLAWRQDVFLHWGLSQYQMMDWVQAGGNCSELIKPNSAATLLAADPNPASLDHSIIGLADLSDKSMPGISIKSSAGNDVYAQSGMFDNADLSASRLPGSDFRGSSLQSANFSNTDLGGADFRKANLTNANFTGSFLRGADFTGAITTGAVFAGADTTHAKGLTAFTTAPIIPARYKTLPVNYPGITAAAIATLVEIAALAGQTILPATLQAVLDPLPADQHYNYNYELPVQGGPGTVALIARSRGEAGANAFAAVLNQQGQEGQAFIQACRLAGWPSVGLRLSVTGSSVATAAFIDGPVGWPEVSVVLQQLYPANEAGLQSIIDAADNQSLYLWSHDQPAGSDEIALRVRPEHVARLQQLAQLADLPVEEADPVYKMLTNAGAPAVLFLKTVQGKIAPQFSVYLPVTTASKLGSYPLTDAGKQAVKALLDRQKTNPLNIKAIQVQRSTGAAGAVEDTVSMYL